MLRTRYYLWFQAARGGGRGGCRGCVLDVWGPASGDNFTYSQPATNMCQANLKYPKIYYFSDLPKLSSYVGQKGQAWN